MLYLTVLYLSLADPDFATREAAEGELVRLVAGWPWEYGQQLNDLARDNHCPETAYRLLRPLRVYDCWRANNYTPKGIPVFPCCDMLPLRVGMFLDIRDRQSGMAWMSAPTHVACDSGPYWHSYRRGTERMARQMIREGVSPEQVDDLLRRAWKIELSVGSDCNATSVLESWSGWAGGYPQAP